jgi:hypothetical protein
MKRELLEIFNSETFDDEYIKNQIPTKNSKEFIQDIQKNIEHPDTNKEKTIKRLKRTINKENIDDKRKTSKIKAQNFAAAILNYFMIDDPDDLIKKPLKLKKLFENEEEVDKLFPNCLKSEKKNCYHNRQFCSS